MRVYTVHCRPDSLTPDRDLVLVKEGFSWPGFVFTAPWALWHGMWLTFLALLGAGLAIEAILLVIGADSLTEFALGAGFAMVVGYGANDWRRNSLKRRGYRMIGLVAAGDRDAAARRFFDLNPDMAPARPGPPVGSLWDARP